MKIGYARVSTEDQRLDRQEDALKNYGCEKIFMEKASGMKDDRPQLAAMLAMLREGDQVVVVKLDRISRSTKHLIELSEKFDGMGVDFISLGDSIDTSTPMGRFFFKVMASIAELERDIIAERTKDGLKAARARGRKGGRPRAESPEWIPPGRCTNQGASASRRSAIPRGSPKAPCTDTFTKQVNRDGHLHLPVAFFELGNRHICA